MIVNHWNAQDTAGSWFARLGGCTVQMPASVADLVKVVVVAVVVVVVVTTMWKTKGRM